MSTETIPSKEAILAEGGTDQTHLIHGVAIGDNDVTMGSSGQRKRWTPDALQNAADTLSGKPLVKNHVNDKVESVIGRISNSKYKPGEGVLFEAELTDKDISDKIRNGQLDVSARIEHEEGDESEEDDELSIINKIKRFVNLSVVPIGAAPSNRVESGPASNLSATELAAAFDHDVSEAGENDAHEVAEGMKDEDLSDTTEDNTSDSEASEDEVVELAATHSPTYSGTSSSGEWSSLAMEDFDTDDLSEISKHFLATKTDFPPENFGELSLEVVNTNGELVLGGLDSAWKTASSVDGLSDEQVSSVKSTIANLAQDEFPDSDLADRVSDSDNTEENEADTEDDAEELDEESESADESSDSDGYDFSSISVMSDGDFESRLNGERSTDTEENQRYQITVDL